MSDVSEPGEERSEPAERALGTHLELLRTSSPAPRHTLVARIMRSARWQRAIRSPLLAVAAVASAVIVGVRLLFGGRHHT